MTLQNLSTLLRGYQIPKPSLEALNLLELVTQKSQSQILSGDFQLKAKEVKKLLNFAQKRVKTPLAYFKKSKEFYGLNFYVDEHVLIPRPESEDLISLALELDTPHDLYDIGSGSGCLGISYAHQVSKPLKVTFIDCCPQSLLIAKKNCQTHQIDEPQFKNLNLRQIEILKIPNKSLIIANLPYLDEIKRASFEADCPILKSEPASSLYTSEGGLYLYRQLLAKVCPKTTILCESLPNQRPQISKLAQIYGYRLTKHQGFASLLEPRLSLYKY